ncbi:hypothetical protein DJ568_02645 [Mucilaginibacter hurinus]|uniref:Carboxypeptidase-like regulatory domain-containing protein n=1 Tax=Mucilaginibacter hurinus TaxID=2201324 RepID=A0A367GTN3_9SPHI|nr:hypothetical protein [Mucilaginibacter hurinus]RCH56772.1 hypothetical protein DJ568_02645 [Mucilaginibacter hurinus]
MKIQIALFVCLFSVSLAASAQELKGTVYDGGSNAKMANVFVRDLNNNQVTMTDNNGNFSVKAAPGHLVVFTSPAYLSDTIYVVDFVPKTIRLASEGVSLQEVNITGKRLSFDPRRDYRQVYEKAKIRPLSPTSWFSKDARDARRLKKFFKREVQEREIDEVFNKKYVSSIIPLRGQELEDYMTLYRPTYEFATSSDAQAMLLYVNDTYKKFKALPPEKQKAGRLQ